MDQAIFEDLMAADAGRVCADIARNFEALRSRGPLLAAVAVRMIRALRAGNRILFCGNGGSATDSQHLAAELMGRFRRERRPSAAIALAVDTSARTAIGNDYGFHDVFARQLAGLGRDGDVMAELCDLSIRVPATETARVQQMHVTFGHLQCGFVEDAVGAPA